MLEALGFTIAQPEQTCGYSRVRGLANADGGNRRGRSAYSRIRVKEGFSEEVDGETIPVGGQESA